MDIELPQAIFSTVSGLAASIANRHHSICGALGGSGAVKAGVRRHCDGWCSGSSQSNQWKVCLLQWRSMKESSIHFNAGG